VSTVWVVSSVLAWVVIALLVAVVLSLLRQTAELRLRLDEFDGGELFEAPDDDARLHEAVPAVAVPVLPATPGGRAPAAPGEGGPLLTLGGLQDRPALLVFHSPGCHGCVGVEEAVEELAAEEPDARIVSVLALRRDDAADHLRRRPLPGVPTVSIDDLPQGLRRPSTPSMLGLSRDGTVALLGRPDGVDGLRRAAQATSAA
jgi:thiol-disulfide isomerase/thioredoxin